VSNTTSVSTQEPKSSSWNMMTAAALGLSVALAGGNFYLLSKTDRLENQMKEMRAAMKTELAAVQQDVASRSSQQSQSYNELRQQLEETGSRSAQAASKVATVAKRYSEELAKKMSQQAKIQAESQQVLVAQLSEMRDASSSTAQRVSGIATDVTTVRGDVEKTKSDLSNTVNELRSVRGDLGLQSGLIATNSKELAALRAMGERDYVEFQLTKTKSPQRIGDVAVQLKKFDNKRNRYTIELIANDKRVEKRDRSINEPVQFYLAKARIPYELVVNEVKNDRIVGYLAAPKIRDLR
jgi:DNA repair exonuclease SbcCD ATPase subunit